MTGNAPSPINGHPSEGPPGLPRWVRVLVIGAVIALILVVVAMLVVGGEHGPGMHGG